MLRWNLLLVSKLTIKASYHISAMQMQKSITSVFGGVFGKFWSKIIYILQTFKTSFIMWISNFSKFLVFTSNGLS